MTKNRINVIAFLILISSINSSFCLHRSTEYFHQMGFSVRSTSALNLGRVLYFPMDEDSGTDLIDYSGYGNDGKIFGASWVSGVSGKALGFDGIDDYLNIICNDRQSLSFSKGELTVSVWVNYHRTLEMGSGYVSSNTIICQVSAIKVFQLSTYGNKFCWHRWGIDPDLIGKTQIDFEKWYHVTATFDGANHSLYVNGIREDQQQGTIDFFPLPIHIGRTSYPYFYFKGIIDEIQVFNNALAEDEIWNDYQRIAGHTSEREPFFSIDVGFGIRVLLLILIGVVFFLTRKFGKQIMQMINSSKY